MTITRPTGETKMYESFEPEWYEPSPEDLADYAEARVLIDLDGLPLSAVAAVRDRCNERLTTCETAADYLELDECPF